MRVVGSTYPAYIVIAVDAEEVEGAGRQKLGRSRTIRGYVRLDLFAISDPAIWKRLLGCC